MRVKVSKSLLWKAIRAKCIDCCGGSHKMVTECDIKTCPLSSYRFGKAQQPEEQKED